LRPDDRIQENSLPRRLRPELAPSAWARIRACARTQSNSPSASCSRDTSRTRGSAAPSVRWRPPREPSLSALARQKVNGKARYQVEIMIGDPGVEILQAAKRRGADLIVMATHGLKGLRRLVLGS